MVWLVTSLPVVTAGAASTALYYTVVKVVRHERGRLLPSYFAAFKSNFKESTRALLLLLGYAALGAADMYALALMGLGRDSGSAVYYLSILFFVPPVLTALWVFPYVSRFGNTLKGTLKYVWYLLIRNFGKTLLLAAITGGTVLICWLMPLITPLLPGVSCFLASLVIEPVFRSITESDDGDGNADPWYNE